ncbi:hypothetical protein C8R44DRAFT_984464 [Mycena epipterygia]|nr:hypothetical protein C8R44DRAFT_984464 [Mycena epipterygia]
MSLHHVLLELTKQLDVADLTSLLATCRLIRELQLQRSLWLEAIAQIKSVQMQPLPLSSADELDAMSLQQLQDTVRRANRLIHNLRSDTPRPVLIQTLSLEAMAGIFCIPGANLVVSHCSGSGTVSVWDISTLRRVAFLEIPDLVVHRAQVCLEIKGKALGARIRHHLVAICIEYRNRAHVSISHIISPNIRNSSLPVYGTATRLFIYPDILGLFTPETGLLCWSMIANDPVQNISERIDQPLGTSLNFQPFGRHLYVLGKF